MQLVVGGRPEMTLSFWGRVCVRQGPCPLLAVPNISMTPRLTEQTMTPDESHDPLQHTVALT